MAGHVLVLELRLVLHCPWAKARLWTDTETIQSPVRLNPWSKLREADGSWGSQGLGVESYLKSAENGSIFLFSSLEHLIQYSESFLSLTWSREEGGSGWSHQAGPEEVGVPRTGWALGTEGLTTKRLSESEINGLPTAERQKPRRKAETSQAEEHATRETSGTEEEVAIGHSGGTAQVWLSRGGALKERREK